MINGKEYSKIYHGQFHSNLAWNITVRWLLILKVTRPGTGSSKCVTRTFTHVQLDTIPKSISKDVIRFYALYVSVAQFIKKVSQEVV